MGCYGENFTKEFFRRTLKNLEVIDEIHDEDPENYPPYNITHLINSLLGLVVFVKDGTDLDFEFTNYHKYVWNGEENISNLIRHLRNSIAHKRIEAMCDDRGRNIIGIIFKDRRNGDTEDNFKIYMTTEQIRDLIRKLEENISNN